MPFINYPPNLKDMFDTIHNRLGKLETAQRFTAPNVATDPSNTRNGDIWLNTALNGLKVVDANGAVQQFNLGVVTSFVPTISAQTGTFGSVTAVSSSYSKIGKVCVFSFTFTITTVGTAANGIFVSLPFPAGLGLFTGVVRENAVVGWMGQVYTSSGASTAVIFKWDNTSLAATGYTIIGTLTYLTA